MPHLGLIDALEFARLGQVLEGGVPIDAFERLAPMLCDRAGELHYRLAGSVDARGAAALDLEFHGSLRVNCQRCLRELVLPLNRRNRFSLVAVEPAWSAELVEVSGEEPDEIVAGEAMDVLALLEDELLLSLPIAPRHEACELATGNNGNRRESPFGILAQLKISR